MMHLNWYQDFLHTLGTKSLLVSVIAQIVVLVVAVLRHKKPQIVQEIILIAALGLLVVSISLRPPAPPLFVPDLLGSIAAVLFAAPAVKSLLSLRSQEKDN